MKGKPLSDFISVVCKSLSHDTWIIRRVLMVLYDGDRFPQEGLGHKPIRAVVPFQMGLCLSSPTLDNRPGRYGQNGYQQGYGYPPSYGQQQYAQQQYAQAQYGVYGPQAGYPPYGGTCL